MTLTPRQTLDAEGYVVGPAPGAGEVGWLRDFVEQRWRDVLTGKYPDLAPIVAATPITAYHTIADRIDHAGTFIKDVRCFSAAQVEALRTRLGAFKGLEEAFGPFDIVDIEGLGHPEVYWRLVRPGHPADVAGAHADAWFYTLTNHMPRAEQEKLIKVWLPVHAEIGVSGLSVGKGSHRLGLAYTGEMRHGRIKPVLTDPRARQIDMTIVPLAPGQCVAFHIDLLHQGVSHDNGACRVSIEFAIRPRTP